MRHIDHDEHDDRLWDESLDACPSLYDVWRRGGDGLPTFQDFLADVFQLVHQPLPRWLVSTVPTFNECLLRELMETREFNNLKQIVNGDAANATMATAILGRQALERLVDVKHGSHHMDAAPAGDGDASIPAGQDSGAAGDPPVQPGSDTSGSAAALGKLRRALRQASSAATAHVLELEESFSKLPGVAAASLAEKLQLADQLVQQPKLAKIFELAGRMERIALAKRRTADKRMREEIVGMTVGGDPGRALPGELAQLAHPSTKALFLRNLVERQLSMYDQHGHDRLGRGPIVLLVDGSGSMVGSKEVWAKAVALVFLNLAAKDRRDMLVCQFGGPGEQLVSEFPFRSAPRTIQRDAVVRALDAFLNSGSTDLEGPLTWALGRIEPPDQMFERADVVVLTDAELTFSLAFKAWWHAERKRLDFASYSVLIGQASAMDVLRSVIEHVAHIADVADDDAALDLLFGAPTRSVSP